MKCILLFLLSLNLAVGQDSIVYEAPVWSPDGNQICYISNQTGATEIYLQDIADGTVTKLTKDGNKKWTPAWSPDGTKIAFVSENDGNKELYCYSIASKSTKRITNTPVDESMPSWNPNSKSLLYISSTEDSPNQIMETTLSGKSQVLLQNPNTTYIYPSLSSDEKRLLYCYKALSGGKQFHVAVLNLETAEETPLETMGYVSYNPNWACGDTKIVFVNQEIGEIQSASIVMMASDGSSKEKIITCEGGCFQPKADADCHRVLYRDGWRDNHKGIFTHDLSTMEKTRLVDHG